MERIISNELLLGAFIHDARIKQKLTQGTLASKAGVSRTWLIGLEQGTRSRAELGKIFDTLEALGISMKFSLTETAEDSSENDNQSKQQNSPLVPQSTIEAIRRAAGLATAAHALGLPAENIINKSLSRASAHPHQRYSELIPKAMDRVAERFITSSLDLQDPLEKNTKIIAKSLDRAAGRTAMQALNRITKEAHVNSRPLSKIIDPLERVCENDPHALTAGKALAAVAAKDRYRNAGQAGLAALRNSALTGKPLTEIAHNTLRSAATEHATTKDAEYLSGAQTPTYKRQKSVEES